MTNFAIIRMNKIKTKNDFIHLQRHNFRMNNTPNSDKTKTHLNENLRDFEEVKKVFDDFFHNENAKFGKRRKNAVLAVDFLMTASPDFFNNATDEEIKIFFDDCKKFIADKHGDENILNASIHYDEQTPHLHMTVVPVNEFGKLNCRSFYGMPSQLRKLQDDFAEMTKKQGYNLKRGIANSKHKHETIRDFNQIIKQAELQADQIQEEYKINVPKKQIFSSNYTITKDDYEKYLKVMDLINDMIQQNNYLIKKYNDLKIINEQQALQISELKNTIQNAQSMI